MGKEPNNWELYQCLLGSNEKIFKTKKITLWLLVISILNLIAMILLMLLLLLR